MFSKSRTDTAAFDNNHSVKIRDDSFKSWTGAGYKILSCFCFAMLNGIVRYLTGGAQDSPHTLTPSQLAFLQDIVGSMFFLPWIFQQGIQSLKTQYPLVHALRIMVAALGIIMLYYAFKFMPVAEAVALQFTGPIFTAVGAWLYLKEKLSIGRFLGIIVGLIGVFIVTRPDRAFVQEQNIQLGWILLLPIGSAMAFAVAKVLGRQLAKRGESAALLTCYLVVFMVPATLGPALYAWVWPTLIQWGFIVVLGLCAWAGHYTLAKAYTNAEILFLTPFGFSRLLFSAMVAWLAFAEMPKSINFWIGAIVIFISTILISVDEQKQKNK